MSVKTEHIAKPIPELTETEIQKLVHQIWDSNFELVDYKVTPYSNQKLGFLADHFSIFLDVRNPKTMELRSKKLFLKTKPLKNMCNMVESMNVFEKEICFYNELLPLMTKNFVGNPWAPTCYSSSENSLIIEDLREKGFSMRGKILSKEELTSAMKSLAVMHAASITVEEKLGRPLNEVYPQAFQMKYFFEGSFHDWISTGFNLAEALAKKLGLDGDKMKNICNKFFYPSLGPSKTKINVVSHADTWCNNLMFTEDSPPRSILIDFQMLRYCPLVYDGLFMLYLCSAWSELVHGVDEIRLGVAILSMLYFPTAMLDGDKCADLFHDPDEMTKFVMVDRVDKTLEMMECDETYAERIIHSVQEVYELGVPAAKTSAVEMGDNTAVGNLVLRRRTGPLTTIRIWDAISVLSHGTTLPTIEEVTSHLSLTHCITEKEAQEQLNIAAADGLIFFKTKYPTCDSLEVALPENTSLDEDSHDWYCCECQKAGLVHCCEHCYRVFHPSCHKPSNPELQICSFCEYINSDAEFPDKARLKEILKCAVSYVKTKLPIVITNRQIVSDSSETLEPVRGLCGSTWISDGEDAWRPDMLIKKHMDSVIMDLKIDREEYKKLAEFEVDAHNIFHNMIVYHGASTELGEMGKTMYNDCVYDIKEIRRCSDCYVISTLQAEEKWFCIPCNPPHPLVFAKQKGYPYWPAKVMKIENGIYDVRFFGDCHKRAEIEKQHIKSITTKPSSLQIKQTAAWKRAYEELRQHQKRLKKIGHEEIAYRELIDEQERSQQVQKLDEKTNDKHMNSLVIKELKIVVERLDLRKICDQKVCDEEQVDVEDEQGSEFSTFPPSSSAPSEIGSEDILASEFHLDTSSSDGLQKSDFAEIYESPRKRYKLDEKYFDQRVATAMKSMLQEIESDKCRELEIMQAKYERQLRELAEQHERTISETKKKLWCSVCEVEASFHCCWSNAYCSLQCQKMHWKSGHERRCRRKKMMQKMEQELKSKIIDEELKKKNHAL